MSTPMRTLTVSIPVRQADLLRDAVESGAYGSPGDVVRTALELWESQELRRGDDDDQLRRAYEAGMRSGEPRRIDREEFLASLKRESSQRA